MRLSSKIRRPFATIFYFIATGSSLVRADTPVCGTISSSTVWSLAGSPYIVTCDVRVEGAGSPILTIEPGVTVKFNSGRALIIGQLSPGEIQAAGTSVSRITFTANSVSPSAGFWRGIGLYWRTAATSRINFATVGYGGSSAAGTGGISVDGVSLAIDNGLIQSNQWAGVVVTGTASVAITNSTLSQNDIGVRAGVVVTDTASVAITNSTLNQNDIGVRITGPASATVTGSQVSGGGIGVFAESFLTVFPSASVSLQTVQIQNNWASGISLDPKSQFGTFSAVTLTGNGLNNSIQIRPGSSDGDVTWRNSALIPYVVTGGVGICSTVAPAPVLTLEAGVTLRFNAGTELNVGSAGCPGGLQANGTVGNPITFTANSTMPTPGFWNGILLSSAATATSRIVNATVSYAGVDQPFPFGLHTGGVHIQGSSPMIQNTTVQNCLWAGISVVGSGSPTISGSTLSSNPIGLIMDYPASASLQSLTLSNNTGYAMKMDPRITLGTVSGLSATGNGTNAIQLFPATGDLDVSTTWRNTGPVPVPYDLVFGVRVQKATAPVPLLTIEAGVVVRFQATGFLSIGEQYPGELQAVGAAGNPIIFTANTTSPQPGFWWGLRFFSRSTSASRVAYLNVSYAGGCSCNKGGIHVESSSPRIENVTVETDALAGITVNGGNPIITGSTSRANPYGIWIVSGSATVDHTTLTGNTVGGIVVSNGSPVISNCNFTNAVGSFGLRNGAPAVLIDARYNWWNSATGPSGSGPGSGEQISAGVTYEPWLAAGNSTPQFVTSSTRLGRAFNPSIENMSVSFATALAGNWNVRILNLSGLAFRTISGSGSSGTAQWDGRNDIGDPQPDGRYYYQIESTTLGGDSAAPVRGFTTLDRTLSLSNFRLIQDVREFNPASGGRVTYTSDVPFTLTERLWIENRSGGVVRTFAPVVRSDGIYNDIWDGRDQVGSFLLDGPYFVVAELTQGANTLRYDLRNQFLNDYSDFMRGPIDPADPFTNRPYTLSYNFGQPGNVTIAFSPQPAGQLPANCDPPQFCLLRDEYQESGPHTFRWSGADGTGRFRSDIRQVAVVTYRHLFSKNAVVLFGTSPPISNLQVTPSYFGPATGTTQTVSFTLGGTRSANITVIFQNQESGSILHTVTLLNQLPGTITTPPWDGRAGNGMWVAPGPYTITVTAVDTLGNQVQGQTLTNIQY